MRTLRESAGSGIEIDSDVDDELSGGGDLSNNIENQPSE